MYSRRKKKKKEPREEARLIRYTSGGRRQAQSIIRSQSCLPGESICFPPRRRILLPPYIYIHVCTRRNHLLKPISVWPLQSFAKFRALRDTLRNFARPSPLQRRWINRKLNCPLLSPSWKMLHVPLLANYSRREISICCFDPSSWLRSEGNGR